MSPKTIPVHPLGRGGPLVPALGLGLMGMSYPVYGKVSPDEERFALLDRAAELGATFWDTADLYGDGEEFIGRWFQRTDKRDKIFLATKFGYIAGSRTFEVNSTAGYCKECCDKSMKRLGVDSIDLYYVHSVNQETPVEETMRAMLELKAEGKIKYIGLSNVSSRTLQRASAVGRVDAVQLEYSVFDRGIEGPAGTDLLATCRALGCAMVVATPLSRGVLTATYATGKPLSGGGGDGDGAATDPTDVRQLALPRFQPDNTAHNAAVVTRLTDLARRKGCSVAQLALAWLLRQGPDIFPIPGTKQIKYLEENWAALDVKLSDEEEAEIRAFARENALAGATLPPKAASHLFRDTREEAA